MKNNQLSTQIRFYHDSGKSFLADLCQFLQKTIFLYAETTLPIYPPLPLLQGGTSPLLNKSSEI